MAGRRPADVLPRAPAESERRREPSRRAPGVGRPRHGGTRPVQLYPGGAVCSRLRRTRRRRGDVGDARARRRLPPGDGTGQAGPRCPERPAPPGGGASGRGRALRPRVPGGAPRDVGGPAGAVHLPQPRRADDGPRVDDPDTPRLRTRRRAGRGLTRQRPLLSAELPRGGVGRRPPRGPRQAGLPRPVVDERRDDGAARPLLRPRRPRRPRHQRARHRHRGRRLRRREASHGLRRRGAVPKHADAAREGRPRRLRRRAGRRRLVRVRDGRRRARGAEGAAGDRAGHPRTGGARGSAPDRRAVPPARVARRGRPALGTGARGTPAGWRRDARLRIRAVLGRPRRLTWLNRGKSGTGVDHL